MPSLVAGISREFYPLMCFFALGQEDWCWNVTKGRTGMSSRVSPSQRHLFDVPAEVAYFNTAYNSPLLNASRDALLAGAVTKSHPWERKADDFFADAETIRRLAAELFGGDADGYAVVPAASYAGSTAARAIEPSLEYGDRIVVMDEEFPSNYLPWERTARERRAEIVIVPTPVDGNWTQAILDHLKKGVKVVAVGNCHWTNGARIALEPIGAACREIGAAFVIDATQSLGAMPLDLAAIKPDFLFASGYKWLLCPYGFSLLYVSERWRNARPLEEVWMARENASNFAGLVKYSPNYMSGARRFDVGEKCTPTILPGAIAALEQLKTWGLDAIAASLSAVNERIAGHLEGLGFYLPPCAARCPHMFGARLPDGYQGNLVAELMKRNIFISQRGNAVRFAPHLHIDAGDLGRLEETLNAMMR